MSSGIELSSQVWNWYVGFFMSMGMVLAAAISFTLGLLLIDWLYLTAKKVESKTTPPSLLWAYFNLTHFQAIVIGVLLAPIVAISSYSFLFFLVWKLTPKMITAPYLESGATSFLENTSNKASLLLLVGALSLSIMTMVFFFLRSYAKRLDTERASLGLIKKILRRYFNENLLIGFLLMLIAFPVLAYFIYNIALLIVVISPSARHEMTKIVFPGAESLYLQSLGIVGSWLIVVIFIPAIWLFFRGELLRWRYIKENPTMNLIFRRAVNYHLFGLLGYLGVMIMRYWVLNCAQLMRVLIDSN